MIRPIFLTILLFFTPFSLLWAQDDKQNMAAPDGLKLVVDYGLLYGEPQQKDSLDSMPILNPKVYDARIRQWSPPFEWFNSMPVIGNPEKKADSVNYWWDPNSTQKESEQHK